MRRTARLIVAGALCLAASVWLMGCLVSCDGGRNEQGHRVAPVGGDLQHAPAPRRAFDGAIQQACGELGPSEVGEQSFLRFPYLQSVHTTGAELVWVSEGDSPTVHLRNANDGAEQMLPVAPDTSSTPRRGTQWVAGATDLLPGTLYCYELRTGDDLLLRGGLRTAPSAEAEVRFSAMGDLGKDSGDQRAVLDQLKSVDSELLLITGDVAYDEGTLAQLESYFFAVYRDYLALVPVFPATGNHDYGTGAASAFRQAFRLFENGSEGAAERWYSLDWGPVHFALLDTERALAEQATWLRADLAASSGSWNIVVLHKAPFSSGHHGSDAQVQQHLVPVFEELGVDLVLAGHDHNYERTTSIGGVVYVITGGGGRGTREVGSSSFTAFAARVAHFVFVQASPEQLTLHAIDASGAEFDTLRLAK